MGKRHTREERMRGALDAHEHGTEAVARRAGVTPDTVRRWCAEFSVSPANGAGMAAAAAPIHDLNLADPAGGTPDGDTPDGDGFEEELPAFDKWLAEWQADVEGHERRREGLRRVIADWEAEHGKISEEAMQAAEAQLYG